jgi:nitrogen fixation NifU-like protein
MRSMDQLYHAIITDHFRNPRGHIPLKNPELVFELTNPVCGDVVRAEFKISNDKIQEVSLQARGCVISVACASMLTELIIAQDITAICRMNKNTILDLIQIPLGPTRLKCAILCLEAVHQGLGSIKKESVK